VAQATAQKVREEVKMRGFMAVVVPAAQKGFFVREKLTCDILCLSGQPAKDIILRPRK
jgi:hypothetical protein